MDTIFSNSWKTRFSKIDSN